MNSPKRKLSPLLLLGLLLATALASATVFALLAPKSKPTRYTVALRYIPDRLDPRRNQLNTNHFILLHLYYPLFSRNEEGQLESRFLDLNQSHPLDSSYQNFRLCLQKGGRFSDNSPIQNSDLRRSLLETHQTQPSFPALASIEEAGECLQVHLNTKDPNYFNRLTSVASTLLKEEASAAAPFPMGLGPYSLARTTPGLLELRANPGQVRGDFKILEFIKFTDLDLALRSGVADFNHIYQFKLPASLQERFQKLERPILKTYAILLNIQNERHRKALAHCLDAAKLRSLLQMDLLETPGFLPHGVLGGEVSAKSILSALHQDSCSTVLNTQKLPFLLLDSPSFLRLSDFLQSKIMPLPLPLQTQKVTPEELVQAAFGGDHFVTIAGFDNSGSTSHSLPEASLFFESFYRPNRNERMISKPIAGLQNKVREAIQEPDPSRKQELYQQAHRLLLETGHVVPLGQVDTSHYYPKGIRLPSIQWADRISGFPKIDRLRGNSVF